LQVINSGVPVGSSTQEGGIAEWDRHFELQKLSASYKDIGVWAGVIGRKVGNRFEIAFGHHRIEAAKRSKMKEVPIIIEKLTDAEMLRYMGRENGEDYNADFLVMLETWDAAVDYLKSHPEEISAARPERIQTVEIARFLGWTSVRSWQRGALGEVAMSATAIACATG
jgi:hypothetical protein